MPEEVEEKALKELGRLEKMPPAAAETGVIRTYLDWLVGLPWNAESEEKLDLVEAQEILDEDHYGLEKVKERVLEYLAVHKLTDKMRGPILCFVGPPGVGKTSIGRSIARALEPQVHPHVARRRARRGRDPRAPAHLRRRAARPHHPVDQPGRHASNPVFMMDEIDKVGQDFRGDPTSALLEVLDPEQNYAFQDHYLEAPFDLSDVMFITTANLLDTIPPALRDRMEVIHFPGYTEDEKLHIAQAVPRAQAAQGARADARASSRSTTTRCARSSAATRARPACATSSARSRRSAARSRARSSRARRARRRSPRGTLHKYLGPPKFTFGLAEEKDEVGVATGLVWTEVGGDVIFIEATTMPGKGNAHPHRPARRRHARVGARRRVSYIRTRAKDLGIAEDFYEKHDLHIHVPAAAIPKDGPERGHHDGDGARLGAHRAARCGATWR